MSRPARLFVQAERRAGAALAPLLHRRHKGALRRGSISAASERIARDSWWGGDPRWYAGGTPPRQHNRITPLVDGQAFFQSLHEALLNAKDYVYVAGWCLTVDVPLRRREPDDLVQTRLTDVLAVTAQRLPVRVLLWSGAVALIRPTTRTVKRIQSRLNNAGGDLVCSLDSTAVFTHCHHQKAIVIDGQVAFVGGIDLTTFAGDRWDTPDHVLRAGVNWHDVALRIEGEAVADVEANFRQRWEAVTGDDALPTKVPAVDQAWATPAQIVRTIPQGRYDFARRGEYGIHHMYMEALRQACNYVYIETQYLWSPDIMDAFSELITSRDPASFRVVVVLPARATSGKWDNDHHVEKLRQTDAGRGIFEAYSLFASGPTTGEKAFSYRPIYVHAQLAIIDDEWCTVGSANLNNRGLVTDSEINVAVRDPALASGLRLRLWGEHLGVSEQQIAAMPPSAVIDSLWRARAAANAHITEQGGKPLVSSLHQYQVGLSPPDLVLDELEVETFEH
jgi:phosphatidylserine/phosphatidylglycerophosphate/cardiolipin synthase-like enzyme